MSIVLLIFQQFCVCFFVAHLHNQFLLAILTKCQSLGSSVCKCIFHYISLKLQIVVFSKLVTNDMLFPAEV